MGRRLGIDRRQRRGTKLRHTCRDITEVMKMVKTGSMYREKRRYDAAEKINRLLEEMSSADDVIKE